MKNDIKKIEKVMKIIKSTITNYKKKRQQNYKK